MNSKNNNRFFSTDTATDRHRHRQNIVLKFIFFNKRHRDRHSDRPTDTTTDKAVDSKKNLFIKQPSLIVQTNDEHSIE